MFRCRLIVCLVSLAAGHVLIAADWQTNGSVRQLSFSSAQRKTGFTLLTAAQTGISFTNHLADTSVGENQIRLNGSGLALGDVDGDGRCDIYVCRLEGPNALYRNLGGWKFADMTSSAGVACDGQYSTGAALADLDGDADLDLLVNSMGSGTRCFFNDGKGRFTENNSGLLRKFCSTSMALADIDGNGTLDLYVANYRTTTIRSTGLQVLNVNGRRMLRPQDRESYEMTPEGLIIEHAEPDVLYTNDGRGTFTAVSWTDGRFRDEQGKPLERPDRDWGLSVMMRDINGDRAPDIYVCNDFWSPDGIWLNDGKGNFRAMPALSLRTTSTFSMGVDVADINRDGYDDLFVVDMRSREHRRRMSQRSMLGGGGSLASIDERPQVERNTLFLNRGDGTFAEIAQFAGLQASEWSWCPVFIDVDLDGYEDVLVTTGHGFDSQDVDAEVRLASGPRIKLAEQILRYPRLLLPKQAFRNRGDLTFEPAGDAWGFNQQGISQGMALADLDDDGDLDVVSNNLNTELGVYRNDSAAPRIAVRLRGRSPNSHGIGARLELVGGRFNQAQEIISGGRYLSSDDAIRTFAAWNLTNRFTLTVKWRSGVVSSVPGVAANTLVEITEPATAELPPIAMEAAPVTWFRDETSRLGHVHKDDPFDDFARQPLLSKRFSQFGPGVAWVDVDGDGFDDLVIGGGTGGALTICRNLNGESFQLMPSDDPRIAGDHTAVLAARENGETSLFIGLSSYESGDTNLSAAAKVRVSGTNTAAIHSFPGSPSSSGPLAIADIDRDGDLDLFIGGQVNPGRFPEPATSRLYRNSNGVFRLAQEWPRIGLVNGALFTDVVGDGAPDLVIACEWSAPLVFRNQMGTFVQADLGLAPLRGWWTGVTAGDYDADGRMDLVFGNWGRNSPYQAFTRPGFRIYYRDFTGEGRIDGVESYFENGRELPWRDLDRLSLALPWLRGRFNSYAKYGEAGITDIMADGLSGASRLEVTTFESVLFLNRSNRFEPRLLPLEAQLAPIFGLTPGDFDGDGSLDIFVAQNFFAVDADTSRYDAGLGLLLKGDGLGGLTTIPPRRSGLRIHGDQRGAAAADYNSDGRLDLAIGQNRAATRLLRNHSAKPALRVLLAGPPGNQWAIGAVLRRIDGDRRGPAHEIRAGNGWWSQDSVTTLLGGVGSQIWVRWPSGEETTSTIPPRAAAVTIGMDGKISAGR